MQYARSASGDASRALVRVLTMFVLAYSSYLSISYANLKPLLDRYLPLQLPFKSIAVVGGLMYVVWICLAYRLCGSGFGVATALVTASLCLATSPWFGVLNPWWFSAFGVLSFLVAGILCEKVNGAAANACFALTNWIAAYAYRVAPISLPHAVLGLAIAIASGALGDALARGLSKLLYSAKFLRSYYEFVGIAKT